MRDHFDHFDDNCLGFRQRRLSLSLLREQMPEWTLYLAKTEGRERWEERRGDKERGMEGEGLFGKEKVSTHGIQRTSMQREGGGKRALTSPSLSLSQAPKSFHPQFPFISGHYSPFLSFSRCHSKHAAFHQLMKKFRGIWVISWTAVRRRPECRENAFGACCAAAEFRVRSELMDAL